MKPILENLNAKLDEQKYLLRIMSMWNEVKSQGIDLDAVSALGFDPVLMTIVERRDARRKTGFGVIEKGLSNSNPYGWPMVTVDGKQMVQTKKFNYVKLQTGEKIRLTPMVDRP